MFNEFPLTCYVEKVFVSYSLLKDNFARYIILVGGSFGFFITLAHSTLFLLYIVSEEKCSVILTLPSL